jgi:glyoxylase-like metal-dependent hydrolase (beta-lactamase superfamily II)
MQTFNDKIRWVEIPNGDVMDDPTNMFIIGDDPVILIDPGSMPGLDTVLQTLNSLGNPTVEAILLTHVHVDHGASAEALRQLVNAPIRFHKAELPELAESKHEITLDEPIVEGEIIEFAGVRLEAVLTPGHAAGHLSFVDVDDNAGIVGDLVTGWGSSAIFPPWGDLADYIASMLMIADRSVNPLLPSHGPPVTNGPEALRKFAQRRLQREQEILQILQREPLPVETIRDRLYTNVPQDLISDVTGNVLLHLQKLESDGKITQITDNPGKRFALVDEAMVTAGTTCDEASNEVD